MVLGFFRKGNSARQRLISTVKHDFSTSSSRRTIRTESCREKHERRSNRMPEYNVVCGDIEHRIRQADADSNVSLDLVFRQTERIQMGDVGATSTTNH